MCEQTPNYVCDREECMEQFFVDGIKSYPFIPGDESTTGRKQIFCSDECLKGQPARAKLMFKSVRTNPSEPTQEEFDLQAVGPREYSTMV